MTLLVPSEAYYSIAISQQSQSRTIILDLGDVLFHWHAHILTALSPSTFYAVVLTPTWGDLERGKITEEEAFTTISEEFSLEPHKIREAVSQCKSTLHVDLKPIEELQLLKNEMNGDLRIVAM
jgi:FMN phosphatase YigB (HAD superfamily)